MNKADCICELKWIRGVYAGMRKEYGSCVEALDMAINALEQTTWIPCSERLPEEKQDVLLLMPHNMVVGFWEDVLSDGGRTWYANSGDGYFTDMDVLNGYDDPIAWMPLPDPWKEET